MDGKQETGNRTEPVSYTHLCAVSILAYAGLGWLGGVALYCASVPLLAKLKLLGVPLGGFNLIPPIKAVIIVFLVLALVPLSKRCV